MRACEPTAALPALSLGFAAVTQQQQQLKHPQQQQQQEQQAQYLYHTQAQQADVKSFCYGQFESPPSSCAQLYPNNTLLADLIHLHPNIASLWPRLLPWPSSSVAKLKLKPQDITHQTSDDTDLHQHQDQVQDQGEAQDRDQSRAALNGLSHMHNSPATTTTTTIRTISSNHNYNHYQNQHYFSPQATNFGSRRSNFNYDNFNNNNNSTPVLINYATNKDHLNHHNHNFQDHNHHHPNEHPQTNNNHQPEAEANTTNKLKNNKINNKNKNKVKKRKQLKYKLPQTLRDNQSIRLSAEDYNKAICVLSADSRFKLHLLLYQRIPILWLVATSLICVLLPPVLLLSLEWLSLVGVSCLWLCLQACGVVVTGQLRRKLDFMLEKSVAQVNSYLVDHNLLLGVINSCSLLKWSSKLMIPIIYYDTSQCRGHIESMINNKAPNSNSKSSSSPNDTKINLSFVTTSATTKQHLTSPHSFDHINQHQNTIDDIINKPQVLAMAQSQQAKRIILRFSQRWISNFERRKLVFGDDCVKPRHLSTGKCLCQFFEEQFASQPDPLGLTMTNCQDQQLPTKLSAQTVASQDHQRKHELDATQPELPSVCRRVEQLHNQPPSLASTHSSDATSLLMDQTETRASSLEAGQPNAWQQHLCQASQGSQASHSSEEHLEQATEGSNHLRANLLASAGTIGPGDDLVQKLRSLLASRKHELQILDGCLFSDIIYRLEQSPLCAIADTNHNGLSGAQQDSSDKLSRPIHHNHHQRVIKFDV